MFIDLHMHERCYSKDSFLTLEEIVMTAREKGLDGICITDHDSMGLRAYAQEYSQKVEFPIFVGIEFYSLQGDIVAFGIEDYPAQRMDAQYFIDMVKEQGGICFSAHPFRNNKRGLEEYTATLRGLDGIEVLNGSTQLEACKKAARYARDLNLIPVGSSDCHVIEKIGMYATYFPQRVSTIEEFVHVFREGNLKPAYYENGSYQVLDVNAFANN